MSRVPGNNPGGEGAPDAYDQAMKEDFNLLPIVQGQPDVDKMTELYRRLNHNTIFKAGRRAYASGGRAAQGIGKCCIIGQVEQAYKCTPAPQRAKHSTIYVTKRGSLISSA